jgi:hypothetical protein
MTSLKSGVSSILIPGNTPTNPPANDGGIRRSWWYRLRLFGSEVLLWLFKALQILNGAT